MTIEELRAALDAAHLGAPDKSVESAITVYQVAAGMVDAYTEVKDQAKALIGDVMAETGVTSYTTRAGKVAMTAPGCRSPMTPKHLTPLRCLTPAWLPSWGHTGKRRSAPAP